MEVPQKLKALPQWICWKNCGKNRKVPFQILDGSPAKTNDPTTWSSYPDSPPLGYLGLGFVFSEQDGFFGVDLDGCRNPETGEITHWGQEWIRRFASYAEVSPSGTGVKIYGIGQVPGGKGKKKNFNGSHEGVECYDRGRYFCFTGQRMPNCPTEPADCQEALDAFLEAYWPAPSPPPALPSYCQPRDSVADRAAKYLAKIPGAVAGQGRDNKTFHVACILTQGFDLTVDQALPLLAAWNETCSPNDQSPEAIQRLLRHKLADAAKQPGERGYLLNGRQYGGPDVDLRAFLDSFHDEPIPDENVSDSDFSENFPNECFDSMPSLMRTAYEWTLETAVKPQPVLTVASLIALFGAIFGRRVKDDYNTRTNVMVLALSPSGSGKEHPRQCNKNILFHSGLSLINGPERIGSHAGIVSSLHHHQSRLFQIDEIGRLLATMQDPRAAPHLYNIGTMLMALYSSAGGMWTGDAYADLKKVKQINQPCACVFGTSIPEGFYENLTPQNLSDGLLARMIVMDSGGHGNRRKPILSDPPAEMIQAIKWWHGPDFIKLLQQQVGADKNLNLYEENPTPLLVKKTAEADARHEKYSDEVHSKHCKDDATAAALWSRAPEKSGKLALIHACCQANGDMPVITIESVNWARKIVNYSTRLMLDSAKQNVSLSRYDEEKKKVWKLLKSKMTVRDFIRKAHWLRRRDRDEILSDWEEAGAIEFETEKTAGRPKTFIKKLRNKL